MHDTQRKLLNLAQKHDLSSLGLREIGRMIGEFHPQKVKYHLKRLNLLDKTESSKSNNTDKLGGGLLSIPIYGLANCGEATIYADNRKEGYLNVSKKILNSNSVDGLFAVQAVGDSMNEASINGNSIHNGDYIIINSEDKDYKSGDYVLSVMNGLANVKKLIKDNLNQIITLVSESSYDYPPIFIDKTDFENYLANGKVLMVLKNPKDSKEIRYEKTF